MHYSAAIKLDDKNAIYYANLAAAHNVVKEYEDGLKMALAGRKADPMLVQNVYLQAQSLYGLGRLRDAVSAYEQVFQLQWQIRDSSNVQAQQTQHAQEAQEAQEAQQELCEPLHHFQQQLEQHARMGAFPQQMQQLYQVQVSGGFGQLQQQQQVIQLQQQVHESINFQSQQTQYAQQVQQAQQVEQQLLHNVQQQLEQQAGRQAGRQADRQTDR